jgi:hypothetical protein
MSSRAALIVIIFLVAFPLTLEPLVSMTVASLFGWGTSHFLIRVTLDLLLCLLVLQWAFRSSR